MPQASSYDQLAAVRSQIAAARTPLTTIPAEASLFDLPPVDTAGALRHTAFWVAVAARAIPSWSLAAEAARIGASAVGQVLSPSRTGMVETMKAGAASIGAQLGSARGTGAFIASQAQSRLLAASTPAALELARRDDDSVFGMIRAALETVAKVGRIFYAVTFIGAIALGTGLTYVAWRKWGRR